MNNRIFLFLALFTSYFIVTFNVRAFTSDGYTVVAITDMLLAYLNFFVVKKIQESKSVGDATWYAVGGTCGSLSAMLICNTYGL